MIVNALIILLLPSIAGFTLLVFMYVLWAWKNIVLTPVFLQHFYVCKLVLCLFLPLAALFFFSGERRTREAASSLSVKLLVESFTVGLALGLVTLVFQASGASYWLYRLGVLESLIGGFAEEVYWRGVGGKLLRESGLFKTVLICSFTYAVWSFEIICFIRSFIVGVILQTMYFKRRNICSCIIARCSETLVLNLMV